MDVRHLDIWSVDENERMTQVTEASPEELYLLTGGAHGRRSE